MQSMKAAMVITNIFCFFVFHSLPPFFFNLLAIFSRALFGRWDGMVWFRFIWVSLHLFFLYFQIWSTPKSSFNFLLIKIYLAEKRKKGFWAANILDKACNLCDQVKTGARSLLTPPQKERKKKRKKKGFFFVSLTELVKAFVTEFLSEKDFFRHFCQFLNNRFNQNTFVVIFIQNIIN